MRRLRFCFVLAALVAAFPARAQEPSVPLLPERNPSRGAETRTETAAPAQDVAPDLPGDKPTVPWQDPKVAAARAACDEMLQGIAIDYDQLEPIKRGACGAPAPILVRSIGKEPAVEISPPATMRCTLAVALDAWLNGTVQPAASVLGTHVVKMRNASSYKCRNRYGGANTKISEHALANALDISEFVFASGQRYKVLGNWPYGARQAAALLAPTLPLPNPYRVAEAEIRRTMATQETTGAIVPVSNRRSFGSALAAVTRVKTNPFVRPVPPPVARPPQSPLPKRTASAEARAPQRISVAAVKSNPFVSPIPRPRPPDESERAPNDADEVGSDGAEPRNIGPEEAKAFMRAIHADACKTFETVLGPESNAAHRDHFHFDMKKRRYVKICQ